MLMQGYKHKRAFIVAEGPMKSTVRNFWKMIYERNCAVVVMTSSLVEGGQEASAQYWPDSGIGHYGEFTVDLLGEEKLQGFVIRNLSILNTKVCPQKERIIIIIMILKCCISDPEGTSSYSVPHHVLEA